MSRITDKVTLYSEGNYPDTIEEKDNYRFALGKSGSNPLVVICMNPSAADITKCDKTIEKIIKVANELNKDGWMVFNLYPERATFSEELTNYNPEISRKNVETIRDYLLKNKISEVWGAWGNANDNECLIKSKEDIVNMLSENNINIFCYKINKSGNPHHPLYLHINPANKIYL